MNNYVFGHSCGDSPIIFTGDCVENIVGHGNSCTILYLASSDNNIPQTPILDSNTFPCAHYIPLFDKPGNFLHVLSLMKINIAMEVTVTIYKVC